MNLPSFLKIGALRYLFYLIALNMMVNVIIYVPRILIEDRADGALMSILLAVPLGLLLMAVFIRSLAAFPRKTLGEIMDHAYARWITIPVLLVLIGLWMMAGLITLMGFADITRRFIDPELSDWVVLSLFLLLVSFGEAMRSSSLLYAIEIIIVLNSPIIFFIMFKGVTNAYLSWDAIREAWTHVWHGPNLLSLAAATYTLSGYVNMVIFHRSFPQPLLLKWKWMIVLVGLGNLLITYLIPIGTYGFDGVGELRYPWISTSDTLRMEYAPVERVIFIFLLLYISLSFISATIHWHVAYEMLKHLLKPSWQRGRWSAVVILGGFSLAIWIAEILLEEMELFDLSRDWLVVRFFGEMFLVALVAVAAWRKGRSAT